MAFRKSASILNIRCLVSEVLHSRHTRGVKWGQVVRMLAISTSRFPQNKEIDKNFDLVPEPALKCENNGFLMQKFL